MSCNVSGASAWSPFDAGSFEAWLRSLPGIGGWAVHDIVMRALSWPDPFPHTDHGVRKVLDERCPQRIIERAEPRRPWRAYAVMQLWMPLEEGS
jgi:AraC family transcriptional regulator of adaptative response / DNA-3-methyladenine glycosylase II